MKNSPKLRFKDKNGNVYPEWEEKRIEEILKIKHGKDQKKIVLDNGKYPILATSGEIGRTNTFLWNKPSVLIGRKGTINKPQYMDTPFWTVDTLFYSDVFSNNNAKYIYYLFNTINWKKYDESTGVPSLSAKTIERIKVVVSKNLCEQEKIAGFLSKVDELINECEGEVKDLEEQKKGLMQKIFSQQIRFKDSNNNPYPDWKEHCINEFIISLKSGLSRELQNEDIGIPVIRANNTYNGIVGGNDIKYWYKKDPKGANIDNYILDDGDILINFINSLPRMGETAIYTNFLNRPCIYTTNLLRLKLNNKLNYKYFFYYTKTSEYINYIKAITKPAVNQASFTTVDFKNLKLLLPCLEEQEKIAKVLSKMNELIEEKKALLSDWQQFKKGLLQQMFV